MNRKKLTNDPTIEEAAVKYAEDKVLPETALRGFIDGAFFALAHQWRSVEEEDFPETGSEYIVLTSGGDYCAINKCASKEEVKQYTNIVAWMPIPPLNPEQR